MAKNKIHTAYAHFSDPEWDVIRKAIKRTGMSKGSFYKSSILMLLHWINLWDKKEVEQLEIFSPCNKDTRNQSKRQEIIVPDNTVMYRERKNQTGLSFSPSSSEFLKWREWHSFSINNEKEGLILSLFKNESEGMKETWDSSKMERLELGGRLMMRLIPITLQLTELSKRLRYEILPSERDDMLKLKLTKYEG